MNLEFCITFDVKGIWLTDINIGFDRSLACRSQFHNEGVGTTISSFQQKLRRSNGCKLKVISSLLLVLVHVHSRGFIRSMDETKRIVLVIDQVGATSQHVDCFKFRQRGGCRPSIKRKMCTKFGNVHLRIWIFKFEVRMPLLEEVEVRWPDDGCLTYSLTSLVRHSFRRHPRYYDTFLRDQTS